VCRSDGHGGIQGARHRSAGAEENPQPHGQQERGQSLHRRHHRQPPRQRLQTRQILCEYLYFICPFAIFRGIEFFVFNWIKKKIASKFFSDFMIFGST